MVYLMLFLSFLQVGMFSIGGGYAAIPLIQSQVVDVHGWLTMEEFMNLVTIAEMTPGPIAINSATFVGIRIAGLLGAVIATFGCILPSCILVSILAWVYRKYKSAPAVDGILGCLRPAVVALILAAGISMFQAAAFEGGVISRETVQAVRLCLFLAAFVILRKLKWNPILVMCLCGAGNMIVSAAAGI